MALDIRLRQIVTKAAGIYFIVTDRSQVAAIEEELRLRICFLNTEDGPINSLVKFAQNDITGFNQVFGRTTRTKRKRGDFGHITCESMLTAGPIGVINLRAFDDERDLTQIGTINPNTKLPSQVSGNLVPYTSLFNRNGYWTPRPQNITQQYYQSTGYLNFGNIGVNDVSIFVVKSTDAEVSAVTREGNNNLINTSIEVDDLPGLNQNMLLKDTFVTVFLFNNTFINPTSNNNYGYLFNIDGTITLENLRTLATIRDSGFIQSYIGSVIPSLVSETQSDLSIDKVMFRDFMITGIICDINSDLLETDLASGNGMIDLFGSDALILSGSFNNDIPGFLSYLPRVLTISSEFGIFPPSTRDENVIIQSEYDMIPYEAEPISDTTFRQTVNQGLRIGDSVIGLDGLVEIVNIEPEASISLPAIAVANYDYVRVVFGNGRYFMITNQKWLQSTDGINWTVIQNTFDQFNGYNLTYSDAVFSNRLVALAFSPNEGCNYIVTLDGNNPTFTRLSVPIPLTSLVFGNGRFIAYDLSQNPSSTIVTSSNGINWNINPNTFNGGVSSISYIPGLSTYSFLGQAYGDNGLYGSIDGLSWTLIPSFSDSDRIGGISSTSSNLYILMINGNNITRMYRAPISSIESNQAIPWDCTANGSPFGTSGFNIGMYGSEFYTTDHNIIINFSNTVYSMSERDFNGNPPPTYISLPLSSMYFKDINPYIDLSHLNEFTSVSMVKNSQIFIAGRINGIPSEFFYTWTEQVIDGIVDVGSFSENYTLTYTPAIFTTNGQVNYFPNNIGPNPQYQLIYKIQPFVSNPNTILKFFTLQSYKPVEDQFLNGTPQRQNEILKLINDPGIIKGLVGTAGCRYFVDGFKSFVESDYKYQYRDLVETLNENNRFTTAILNEPFMDDFAKSTNPIFKQFPNQSVIDFEFIPEGGNRQYSTRLLRKVDNQFCFFFGPGNVVGGINQTISGNISNLFYTKRFQFDIVANESGYLSGITELEENFSDNDRKYLERFRYNPIIDFNGGFTIFGNLSSQIQMSKQQQIHNVELLQYIRENLYVMAKGDAFKKGSYDEYLRTQTEVETFMSNLVLTGAIQANPFVQCDLANNTQEVQDYRIKLVRVEYTPLNATEKVVFELDIY